MSLLDINIVHLAINEHRGIFDDVIQLLSDALEQLGHQVHRSINNFESKKLNLVIGHTAFIDQRAYDTIRRSKCRYIVFQMEALDEQSGVVPQFPAYLEFLKLAPRVWDYSEKNISFLAAHGCQNAQYIPLGHSKRLERIKHATTKDIDVCFYGAINQRRGLVLDALAANVRLKVFFGTYGPERDQAIARSKIVLNLHQFDTSQFEQVRISFLLNNRCFVISESAEANPYHDGLIFTDYNKLAACCIEYLQPEMDSKRTQIAEAGYRQLQQIPMLANIRAELKKLDGIPS